MAIAYVGYGTKVTQDNNAGTTITLNAPSGLANGNIVYAFVSVQDSNNVGSTNTPSGWTLIGSKKSPGTPPGTFVNLSAYWAVAPISTYSFTVTVGGADAGAFVVEGVTLAQSGTDTISPINFSTSANFDASSGATLDLTGETYVSGEALVVCVDAISTFTSVSPSLSNTHTDQTGGGDIMFTGTSLPGSSPTETVTAAWGACFAFTVKPASSGDDPQYFTTSLKSYSVLSRFTPHQLRRPIQTWDVEPPVIETNYPNYVPRFAPHSFRRPILTWDVEPPVVETNQHFVPRHTPHRLGRPIQTWDVEPPVVETNVHLVPRFTPYAFRQPVQSFDGAGPPVVETNIHFVPRFTPYNFVRPLQSFDGAGPPVNETNQHFVPRFQGYQFARPVQSWDVEPPVVETNQHFVPRFQPYGFNRPIQSFDGAGPPVAETNPHFVPRFQPYQFSRPTFSGDPNQPVVVAQPETNQHFVPKLAPYQFSRPVQSFDGAGPPVQETNTHFVPRLTPYSFAKPIQSWDGAGPPVQETNTHFVPRYQGYQFARPILSADSLPFIAPVAETNTHYVPQLRPYQFSRPVQSFDGAGPPVAETNQQFVPRFQAYQFRRPVLSADPNPVAETNQHFVPQFKPYNFARPLQSWDGAGPPVVETNAHFVPRFQPYGFSRPIISTDPELFVFVPQVDTFNVFVPRFAQYQFAQPINSADVTGISGPAPPLTIIFDTHDGGDIWRKIRKRRQEDLRARKAKYEPPIVIPATSPHAIMRGLSGEPPPKPITREWRPEPPEFDYGPIMRAQVAAQAERQRAERARAERRWRIEDDDTHVIGAFLDFLEGQG